MASSSPMEVIPNGKLDGEGNPVYVPQPQAKFFKGITDPEGNEVKVACTNCSTQANPIAHTWKEVKKLYASNGRWVAKCFECDTVTRPLIEMEEAAYIYHDPESMRLFREKYGDKGMPDPKKAGKFLKLPDEKDLVPVSR